MNYLHIVAFLLAISAIHLNLFAQEQLHPDIAALVSKDLVPQGLPVAKDQNAYYLLEDFMKRSAGKNKEVEAKDLASKMGSALSEINVKEKSEFLAFRDDNTGLRKELVDISKKPCEVPKALPYLITDLTQLNAFITPMMIADAVYLESSKASSKTIVETLIDQLQWANQRVHCQGTLIDLIVGVSYRGRSVDYFDAFAKTQKIVGSDVQRFLDFAHQTQVNPDILVELVRREYQYGALRSINAIYVALSKNKNFRNDAKVVFDLNETMSQAKKFYDQIIVAIKSDGLNENLKVDMVWWSDYTKADSKFMKMFTLTDADINLNTKDADLLMMQARDSSTGKNILGRVLLDYQTKNIVNLLINVSKDIKRIESLLIKR